MTKVVEKELTQPLICYAEGYLMFPNGDERFSLNDIGKTPLVWYKRIPYFCV